MHYLSVKSLANRYDIAISTVWLRLKQGKLPQPIKLHGTSTRWKLDDLEKWEQQSNEK
jgi:prophage regulatory protein|nr:DNA-binding protein [uncultured Glaciecola sp.]